MATAQKIFIDSQNLGLWDKVKQTDEAARKATELLQKDLEASTVLRRVSDLGLTCAVDTSCILQRQWFPQSCKRIVPALSLRLSRRLWLIHPTQIVHHILSLYGTGADATQLQKGFDANDGYQRPPIATHQRVIEDLRTWDHASKYLAQEQYYPDFLAYFQREISDKGWQAVVSEHLLAGTEAADDLLVRLHAGLLHPMLQLMYGIEWEQPAIVAAALAQTCVHKLDFREALRAAEEKAHGAAGEEEEEMPRVMSLLREAHGHRELAAAAGLTTLMDWERGGVPGAVLDLMGRVRVRPGDLEEKTVEMFDAAMFTAAAATFHAPKINKFDFFLM